MSLFIPGSISEESLVEMETREADIQALCAINKSKSYLFAYVGIGGFLLCPLLGFFLHPYVGIFVFPMITGVYCLGLYGLKKTAPGRGFLWMYGRGRSPRTLFLSMVRVTLIFIFSIIIMEVIS